MKLLQLNAWGGRLEKQIAHLIETEQPDIICLQEALSYPKPDAGFFITAENIQSLIGAPHIAFAPTATFSLMNASAKWGNCIISRWPITQSETVFTNLRHQENWDLNEHDYNIRNFLHTSITVPTNQTLEVITHHGHHVRDHKNGNADTLKQMRQLGAYLSALKGPMIVAGDFNLAPTSPSLEFLNNNFMNLPIAHKLTTTRTSLTQKLEVCDYIFVSNEVGVEVFRTSEIVASDHQALILECSL